MPQDRRAGLAELDPESAPGKVLALLKDSLEQGFAVKDEEQARFFISMLGAVCDSLYRIERESRDYLLEQAGLRLPASE